MPQNSIQTRGRLNSTKPSAGGGATLDHPLLGIVKDNIDPTRSGKIRVQIEGNTNKESDNPQGWYTVRYLSTYFGVVRPTAGQDSNGEYISNPSSYGQWQSPPDIGTEVVCIFINGDPNRGFYIGGVPDPESLQMVPAIGAVDNIIPNSGESTAMAGASRLPVTNINTNNRNQADSNDYLTAPKPIHSYTASIMVQQGIIRDPIRGPISSSASREPMSRVGWGVVTPGRPIMEGGYTDENLPDNLKQQNSEQLKVIARRGGHSIVMDDGDIIGRDQLIRIRTALGHQILMSDDGQTMMLLHSNGQSYIELGKEGTVDIYSTNSINMRTQGDLNLHADQHVNIHANENLNIQAKNIHFNTDEEFKIRSGKNLRISTVNDFTVKSTGAAAINSDGEASIVSSQIAYIKGTKVNLNTGKPSTTPPVVPIITLISQTDTLYDQEKGFLAAPGKLLSIATRTPAHCPWAAAGQGVDVKNSLDSASSLPPAPSAAVQSATQKGISSGAVPPSVATVASAPSTKSISKSLDKSTTSALAASVATAAATGPASKVTKTGSAIINSVSGTADKLVVVGSYAQTPGQLVNSGILKPGSATLITGLANEGKNISQILPKQLFAGKPGAQDLTSLMQDVTTQTNSMIDNLQKTQNTLGKIGMVTGKETPTQLSGLVLSGATSGLQSTVNAVKNVAGVATSVSAGASSALKAIGSGAAAAGLAQKLGGQGGISNAIKALGKLPGSSSLPQIEALAKGAAAGAFSAIKESIKPLIPNVPQSLSATAKAAATETAIVSSSTAGSINSITGIANSISGFASSSISDVTGILKNNTISGLAGNTSIVTPNIQVPAITSNVNAAISGVNSMIGASSALATGNLKELSAAATSLQSGLTGAGSALLSSGVGKLPGQLKTVSSVINNASNVLNNIPGASEISGLANSLSGAAGKIGGVVNSLAGALTKPGGLTSALSSTLPLGAASGLMSAISSLGAGGPAKIKMPTISFNTFDRAGITGQIKSILSNPKIPEPNLLGDIKPAAPESGTSSDTDNKIAELKKKKEEAKKKRDQFKEKKKAAKDAYQKAKNDLPAGDPQIAALKKAYEDAEAEYNYVDLQYTQVDLELTNAEFAKTAPELTAIVQSQAQQQINIANRLFG